MRLSIPVKRAAVTLALLGAALLLRRPLIQAGGLALGGAVLAFCISPLSSFYERKLSRPGAALAGVGTACAALLMILWLALPTVVREIGQLGEALPRSLKLVSGWIDGLSRWAEARLPGVRLPDFPMDGVMGLLTGAAAGMVGALGSLADGVSRLAMMLTLAYFFLCDRERLLLRLELLVPSSVRPAAVRAGRGVLRELRLYLQGQLMVAGAVGAMAAAGLWLIGMRSAAVLGGIVGLLNMVPYFGPLIGGVPAVLAALSEGPLKAALCAGVLALVQQADAAILSPRIMGSLTGFSPAAVLLAITAGGSLWGIGGMFVALPLWMSIRTVFRVFVQSYENI